MEVKETSSVYLAPSSSGPLSVRLGYKQTEVGQIPEEWAVYRLGEILTKRQLGGNYRNSERETQWPLIKMGNLGRGKISLGKIEFVDLSQPPAACDRLAEGDVLFNTRNTAELVGKVAIWRGELPEAYFNSNIMRMEFDESCVSSKPFINFMLNTPKSIGALRAIAIGTTSVAAIYSRDLVNLPVAVPPKLEQVAIAEALSDADALIESLEELIAKKRRIKQGTMQALLTGKQRLPGFRGEIESRRLDQLGRWVGGMTPSMRNPSYWQEGTVPWISSGDVKLSRLKQTSQSVTTTALKDHATTLIPENSVVVVMRSGILRKFFPVAMNMVPMAINQDLKALIPQGGVCAEYILHALIGSGDEILARCLKSGTTVESIEFGWLKSFTILVPSLEEQAAIATILTDMDTELAELETRLAKTRQLKQGMMQELLTGRIRLV